MRRGILVAALLAAASLGRASTPLCVTDYGAPLHNAVADRDIAQVKKLVDAGADVNLVSAGNVQSTTPLALAFLAHSTRCRLMMPDVEIIRFLVERGADVKYQSQGGWAEYGSYNALHRAAMHGVTEVLDLIVRRGADLDEPASGGRSALLLALFQRRHQAAELLLQLGANPNSREANDGSFTALHVAATYPGEGNGTVKALLQYGAKYVITKEHAGGPFFQFSGFCRCDANDIEELIDLLTRAGGSVNESYAWGPIRRDVLSEGIRSSHTNLRIIEAMLRKGADPRWALFTLRERSNDAGKPTRMDMLELLARYGADPERTADLQGVPLLVHLRRYQWSGEPPYISELEKLVSQRSALK